MSPQPQENACLAEVEVTTIVDCHGRPSLSHIPPRVTIEPEELYGSITSQKLPEVRKKLDMLLDLSSLAIFFGKHTEGRPYSLALRLRELGFRGEIHAVGSINQELMHHLVRVGFTHFHLAGPARTISQEIIHPFSFAYQRLY
jgi:uncharacterized protein (DUF934 family)